MSRTIRTFIAIELPEKIVSAISKVQEGIRSYGFKIRWVRPENIHLTLKFLGNIKEADTEKVGKAIFESVKEYKPMSLKAKGIGVRIYLRRELNQFFKFLVENNILVKNFDETDREEIIDDYINKYQKIST